MKNCARILPAIVALAVLAASSGLTLSCSKGPVLEEPAHGESILDRVERIEPQLVTAIPETFRWCDRIEGLEKRRIDVGGAELYVEVEGKGIPLVLINGGPGGTHHYFHPWFSRAKKYARVVYYDQRGCGLSDFAPGDEGYSVGQAVEDLEAVRKTLGFEKWAVLGYSYGGFLAQLYTVLHPERVSGLVLLGASPQVQAELGPSRQGDFITEAEKSRLAEVRRELAEYAKSRDLPRQEMVSLLIYNNFLNGDWKRQHFFRPSPERLAQMALYEWVNDVNFNGIIGQTQGRWDFTGAFERNPIPTLILEGRWDLTWSEKKKDILRANYPNARLVVFENAGHGVYDEQPDEFFGALEEFLRGLRPVDNTALTGYRTFLTTWVAEMKARPAIVVDATGWGLSASRELAAKYSPEWLEALPHWRQFLRTGFALYDVERYAEALAVFEHLEARAGGDPKIKVLGLVWQGHMLDLLGKRPEAVERYRQAAAMDISDSWTHSQYGLKYELSPYARERLATPFQRIENNSLD
ncbi:MAG: alpha/beta fold hydrolase [Candidatus Aminicenantes bacterium]